MLLALRTHADRNGSREIHLWVLGYFFISPPLGVPIGVERTEVSSQSFLIFFKMDQGGNSDFVAASLFVASVLSCPPDAAGSADARAIFVEHHWLFTWSRVISDYCLFILPIVNSFLHRSSGRTSGGWFVV